MHKCIKDANMDFFNGSPRYGSCGWDQDKSGDCSMKMMASASPAQSIILYVGSITAWPSSVRVSQRLLHWQPEAIYFCCRWQEEPARVSSEANGKSQLFVTMETHTSSDICHDCLEKYTIRLSDSSRVVPEPILSFAHLLLLCFRLCLGLWEYKMEWDELLIHIEE